jgi:predicted amidohydrolase
MRAIDLIAQRVRECEERGISVLCCPEAILGGLSDYSDDPLRSAIPTGGGRLASLLAPLASHRVTSILGFSELGPAGGLYNTAAIFQSGRIAGLYRKIHPAIRRSVYLPGSETPVFRAGELTFGVVICNDSNFPELARDMAAQGAAILFIPTNNGLPNERDSTKIDTAARRTDIALARQHRLWVVRADVAGCNGPLTSYGSSEIVDPEGNVIATAIAGNPDLLIADVPAVKRTG